MNEADILAKSYHDKAVVYRSVEKEIDGETINVYELLYIMPCALSQQKSGNHEQNMPQAKITSNAVLFCRPTEDIRQGDKIGVIVLGCSLIDEYFAGKPFIYPSHLEIPLSQELEA